jgi:hypothetical protein
VRPIGPCTLPTSQGSGTGKRGTSPTVGRSPTTPQNAAGDPQGAPEVRAFGKGDHPAGERGGATAGRPASAQREIPWVARCAKDFVDRVRAGGEFRRVGLANDDGAGFLEPRHHRRVLARDVIGIERRPEGCTNAGCRCDVLDADRQAVKQAERLTRRQGMLGTLRARHRGVYGERADRIDFRIEPLDGIEVRQQEFDRTDRLVAYAACKLSRRTPVQSAGTAHGVICPTSGQSAARPAGTKD